LGVGAQFSITAMEGSRRERHQDEGRLVDRVRTKWHAWRARSLDRAKRNNDYQRDRERRGEVGRHGVGENGGWGGV
jgi:hypothetical protein